jgi:hypothetical protein
MDCVWIVVINKRVMKSLFNRFLNEIVINLLTLQRKMKFVDKWFYVLNISEKLSTTMCITLFSHLITENCKDLTKKLSTLSTSYHSIHFLF